MNLAFNRGLRCAKIIRRIAVYKVKETPFSFMLCDTDRGHRFIAFSPLPIGDFLTMAELFEYNKLSTINAQVSDGHFSHE